MASEWRKVEEMMMTCGPSGQVSRRNSITTTGKQYLTVQTQAKLNNICAQCPIMDALGSLNTAVQNSCKKSSKTATSCRLSATTNGHFLPQTSCRQARHSNRMSWAAHIDVKMNRIFVSEVPDALHQRHVDSKSRWSRLTA